MNEEIKREAFRQYFKYFRIWFIITGIFVLITVGVVAVNWLSNRRSRGNASAPEERVYDYADVLTDAEEEDLRACIAKYEMEAHIDIVIVTLNQEMGEDDWSWESNMMNYADDFYDNGKYGWNEAYGDGALLLDNWYEDENGSQKGAWLSTSGKMERIICIWEENEVFDAMDVYINESPYKAYRAAVIRLAEFGKYGEGFEGAEVSFLCLLFVPFVVAVIYAVSNLAQTKAKDTTVPATYVANGRPVMRAKSDDFIRKNVVSHRIESSSGGSSGGSHRGGGSHGSHRSSSGHSHGGGGRRR